MGGDPIESLEQLLSKLQEAIEVQEYKDVGQLLEQIALFVENNPKKTSTELLEYFEKLEERIAKEKEEVVAKLGDLQNLKKYRS